MTSTDPDRWRRAEELYRAARALEAAQRDAFIVANCGADEILLADVRSRLAQPVPGGRLDESAVLPASAPPPSSGLIGHRLGGYHVEALIGVGGMGEVYRARDLRLGRDVAVKLLPPQFLLDADRLARFDREARLLASLNHPNIAAIYGFEEADGVRALVLELVEGDTLAQRIARGPLGTQDALGIAAQVADALDAAHERGIIHRDLKPANIAITGNGVVKVLDFGVAKIDKTSAEHGPTLVTTGTDMHTRRGMIVGTPAYMSPEQMRGQEVDKRTDIWAFGCVLFEMLTGRTAFGGATMSDTVAAVLEREPEWTALPQRIAPAVTRVLRRCLEKEPRRRLRDIADAAADVRDVFTPSPIEAPHRSRMPVVWAIGAMLLVAYGLWAGRSSVPASPTPVTRTTLLLPGNQRLVSAEFQYPMALSPDGTTLAYIADDGGEAQIFVRALNALDAHAIAGTADARHPFFSPDGKWLAFFADGALQKVAIAGGTPLRIVNVPNTSMGGTWGPDDTIVWATRGADLMRISAGGGVPTALGGSAPATWPHILPDGKTVLFTTGAAQESSAIAAMSLDGGPKRIIARTVDSPLQGPAVLGAGNGIAQVQYLSNGFLLYGQSANPGALRAIPFDPSSMSAQGTPVSIANSLERAANGGGVYFVVSKTVLLYATTRDRHQLVWVDRKGGETPISPDRAAFRGVRLSPDGRQIAVTINDETRRSDVWIYDSQTGTKRRLTSDRHNLALAWTPDGRWITFSDPRLVEMPADGAGVKRVLMDVPALRALIPQGTNAYPTSWSPDNAVLLVQTDQREVWMFSRGKEPSLRQLLAAHANVHHGQVSPDGRWIAYASDESGREEVYIRSYPSLGEATPISRAGGYLPHWSRTGRELFFRAGEALMVAEIETTPRLHIGTPQRLFGGAYVGAGRNPDFDVAGDATRFVMIKSDEASVLNQLTVVQNWAEEFKRR